MRRDFFFSWRIYSNFSECGGTAHLNVVTAAIKKYYPRKMALELLCTIYGPNITSDKITATAGILSVKVS
jgi:hypothetical protein